MVWMMVMVMVIKMATVAMAMIHTVPPLTVLSLQTIMHSRLKRKQVSVG